MREVHLDRKEKKEVAAVKVFQVQLANKVKQVLQDFQVYLEDLVLRD